MKNDVQVIYRGSTCMIFLKRQLSIRYNPNRKEPLRLVVSLGGRILFDGPLTLEDLRKIEDLLEWAMFPWSKSGFIETDDVRIEVYVEGDMLEVQIFRLFPVLDLRMHRSAVGLFLGTLKRLVPHPSDGDVASSAPCK